MSWRLPTAGAIGAAAARRQQDDEWRVTNPTKVGTAVARRLTPFGSDHSLPLASGTVSASTVTSAEITTTGLWAIDLEGTAFCSTAVGEAMHQTVLRLSAGVGDSAVVDERPLLGADSMTRGTLSTSLPLLAGMTFFAEVYALGGEAAGGSVGVHGALRLVLIRSENL